MKELKAGITYEEELVVTADRLASVAGSGTLKIFATPWMIAYMEIAALHCVAPYMDGDETTVGTNVNINHVAPCTVGDTVYFKATLVEVDRRRLKFEVTARTGNYEIGNGTHERFVVSSERFMKKLETVLKSKES